MSTRDYVLIPGAWTGAWVWYSVEQALRAGKQAVRSITLSGLETMDADVSRIRLCTHVQEVMECIHARDLRDVVLVGHGYGGLVAGQVADRLRDRVAHTVYVDSPLPEDGVSLVAQLQVAEQAGSRVILDGEGRWPAPDAASLQERAGLSPEHARFLSERLVGHPGYTVTDPVVLDRPLNHQAGTVITSGATTAPTHYGHCLMYRLDVGPWPMLSAPRDIAGLLMQQAQSPGSSCAAG